MRSGNELLGDPKCWLCATLVIPGKIYGPNICAACLPEYKKREFTFVMATQAELDELFPIIRPLETNNGIRKGKGKTMSKTATCRDCEVVFELPVQRGRPAVRCGACRNKTPTVMQFSKNNAATGTKETVELKLEVIDGVNWIENSEPCEGCNKTFMRPRKRGRPPKKCLDCSAWDDSEKAALVTTSQETLDELFSGDKALLQGTPDALPKGAEAQCPPPRGCGRIFTSDSAAEDHKVYGANGSLGSCKDPASLGMEPRERRGVPVWTRPSPKEDVG